MHVLGEHGEMLLRPREVRSEPVIAEGGRAVAVVGVGIARPSARGQTGALLGRRDRDRAGQSEEDCCLHREEK